MEFSIDANIFDHYPELQVGVVVAHGVDNATEHPEIGEQLVREADVVRQCFAELPISEHAIIRSWRDAYRVFGAASRYHSSIEALVTRIVKGKPMWQINPLVDLYNTALIKYLFPIGGEDLEKLSGDLRLGFATGGEPFIPLGEEVNDPPEAGEVGYFDDKECVCRRFNWREADQTKLTAKTRHAIFLVEGIPPANEVETKEATGMLADWVTTWCGGTTECFLLNRDRMSITFTKT